MRRWFFGGGAQDRLLCFREIITWIIGWDLIPEYAVGIWRSPWGGPVIS